MPEGRWISDESNNLGGVSRLDDATVKWTRVGQPAAYQMGGYHNVGRYNPVHKVYVFGGGNQVASPSDSPSTYSRTIYWLSPSSTKSCTVTMFG